ncbi:MAG: carbohydrate binding domain-containing protein [Flavobacteriales bacterium]|nr:hypothetical protein [Flavobacteriales bacterium]MCC6577929.1 carbohydrate binding domain-containing protein [Flavobacteriales bacterium]NUQ14435.1 carbohydrate binding domain-containing protein [Flavobacteriales bacterium]
MKHVTLLAALLLGLTGRAQTLVATSFESWTGNTPDGWVGSKTNLPADSIQQADQNIQFGAYAVRLVNGTSSHKRFTTTSQAVTSGTAYNISFYARGNGEVRTSLFDGRADGFGYAPYNPYITVNGTTWTPYTQQIVAENDTVDAEFILSVRNTVAAGGHLEVDSVRIWAGAVNPPTDASIHQIQYTTAPGGASTLVGQTVNTGGVVCGVANNGYWLQSGSGPWTGIFVFDSSPVALGDSLTLTALVEEYFEQTQLNDAANVSIVSPGNPVVVQAGTTGTVGQEQWEGVLVQVINADCTNDDIANSFGQWTIDDGSGAVLVNDLVFAYTPTLGVNYNVTGLVSYSFSEWKIEPRFAADVEIASGLAEQLLAATQLWPVPANDHLTVEVRMPGVRYQVLDATGRTVSEGSFTASRNTLAVAGLRAGLYTLALTHEGVRAHVRFTVAR